VIQEHAIKLAADYEFDKEGWQKAAIELRQPFWDWSLPNPLPPDEVIALDRVEITQPDGSKVKVQNPFFEFKFQSAKDTETFGKFATTPKTVRRPQTLGPEAETDLVALKE
jgi:tyrosinase